EGARRRGSLHDPHYLAARLEDHYQPQGGLLDRGALEDEAVVFSAIALEALEHARSDLDVGLHATALRSNGSPCDAYRRIALVPPYALGLLRAFLSCSIWSWRGNPDRSRVLTYVLRDPDDRRPHV